MKLTFGATNIIQLNCLLAKYSRAHQNRDALHLFLQIHSSHHHKPDHYTLSTTLAACSNLRHAAAGDQLHGYAIRAGFKAYPHIANTLLSLYAKSQILVSVKRVFEEIENPDVYSWTTLLSACTKLGEVGYTCEVFDEMCNRNEAVYETTARTRYSKGSGEGENVRSLTCTETGEMVFRNVAVWNAIVTGCAESGYEEIAFGLFKRMQLVGVRHDNYTFASVLSLCCGEMLGFGREVHSLVIKTGFSGRTSVVNALLTMYFNGGCVGDAYGVFEDAEVEVLDQITYNAMIAGLVSLGRNVEAFHMFKDMQELCLRPTELTFVSVMSSCSCARVATQVHAQALKIGFEVHTSVSNATITMYSACGDLSSAHMVFGELKDKDTVSWNTIITGYARGSLGKAAILAYQQMQREGVEPNEYTIGSLLASTELLIDVEMIQAVVVKRVLFSNIQVSNALICSFSKHRDMERAYQVFRTINHRNLISWNSLISGLQLNGFLLQGLKEFSELLMSKLSPNVYSFSIVLSICASISSLEHGKQIHGYILKCGYFLQTSLGNALITLYAKCGDLNRSVKVFNIMNEKDNISWNSMISAYAQHGKGIKAAHCFGAMQDSSDIEPDKATFTVVLSACSHAGLIDDGIRIFNSMVNIYGFEPEVDHFSCIVDLLGRAGYFDVAEKLITTKLIDIDSNIWWTLFSSCASHGNLRLGRIIAEILLKNEENNPTVYVLLSNICANAGQWEEAANIRALMNTRRVVKQPGYSWINS